MNHNYKDGGEPSAAQERRTDIPGYTEVVTGDFDGRAR